jgi:hypothetical protein
MRLSLSSHLVIWSVEANCISTSREVPVHQDCHTLALVISPSDRVLIMPQSCMVSEEVRIEIVTPCCVLGEFGLESGMIFFFPSSGEHSVGTIL